MAGFNEENAITYRIDKMRKLWSKKVCKNSRIVRWLVEKDEVRMVKAFCLMEASEHGKLPDLIMSFEVLFHSNKNYGKELINYWLTIWNSPDARKAVEEFNVIPDWDDKPFKDIAEEGSAKAFLECMSSFAKSIDDKEILSLYIMPYAFDRNPLFIQWLIECSEHIPDNLRFILFDLQGQEMFTDILPESQVTIVPNLNMGDAVKEIINASSSGANPAMDINKCLLNIAEGLNKNDEQEIHSWGKEAIKISQKIKSKSLESTAYLAYGSALFQMQKFTKAEELYLKAETTAKEGINMKDMTAPTLLLQSCHFLASSYHFQKSYEAADEYYEKTAAIALSQNNIMMYLEVNRLRAEIMEMKGGKENAFALLKIVYEKGLELEELTQKFSSMLIISSTIKDYSDDFQDKEWSEKISKHANKIWGEEWKSMAKNGNYENIMEVGH